VAAADPSSGPTVNYGERRVGKLPQT
jgi:hypothetical protein